MNTAERQLDKNCIPPMTHPLSHNWAQPDHSKWLIDDKHVVMSRTDFEKLPEYSFTLPTGVYEGKCWKRKEKGNWWLAWFGFCDDPDQCSINFREILLT